MQRELWSAAGPPEYLEACAWGLNYPPSPPHTHLLVTGHGVPPGRGNDLGGGVTSVSCRAPVDISAE